MRILSDLDELDSVIAACDAAGTDDELRAILSSFRMEMQPEPELDPLSSSYRERQLALYERISGRPYSLTSEGTPFEVEAAVRRPFPYSTGSSQTTGDHLVVMGEFLRHLRLRAGARVLELGPGWGNLTLALAALGYEVTCVDIENRYCELIQRRAERLSLTLDVINADFHWAAGVTDPFDAVIFFECFHHAADHLALLRDLHSAVKLNGRIYLGAEPILPDFPVPWGLRLDGQSLWAIRKFGWMELGFRDDYFKAALKATGWVGIRHSVPYPAIWELISVTLPLRFELNDSRIGTITGKVVGSDLVLVDALAGEALFGPYVSLPPGRFFAQIHFSIDQPLAGTARMEICARGANELLASRQVNMAEVVEDRPYLELSFVLESSREDLEVRLINDAGFSGHVTAVEIIEAP